MKIKNVSCTQFAGVRDCNVSFADGINVVYGKNESGKSTVANLISRTLFQNAKLDRRSDKGFYELYFPCSTKGSGISGDFADGNITFETENGTYTLSKEWGAEPRCKLSTPSGVIRDQALIDSILRDVLLYGEGVYSDMLFSTQYNTDISLRNILDASKKTDEKQEIINAVSQAFAESDGIPVDVIEQAIKAKIDEIAGKHWDYEREAPVRKAGRWANGLGEILKTYYALEDARNTLNEISRLETEADRAADAYTDKDVAARVAEESYKRFNTFASRLAVQSERKKNVDRIEMDLRKITAVLENWPKLTRMLDAAKALQAEINCRNIHDRWNLVEAARAEITENDLVVAEFPYPEATDFAFIRKTQREIATLENKLCGMNLNAAIRMFDGRSVTVTSLRTGAEVDVSDGSAKITEAVRIEVPGVIEMQLSPANVDVAFVEEQIRNMKNAVAGILAKFNVETLEELEAYAQKIDSTKTKIENVNTRITRALGNVSLEDLQEAYKLAGPVNRSEEEIKRDIFAVCGAVDPATFIAKTETFIDGYIAEYGSINDLKVRAFDQEAELKKVKATISSEEDIPPEYRSIVDPDDYLESLQSDLKRKQELREAALTEKTASASKLDTYKESHPEACPETVEKAERNFAETKSLLGHWLHIEEVFKAQKESIENNPMQDIAENFTRYLGIISKGKVSSEFPEADKLNMNIYSDNRLLDYGKLSEGTKETVSLAFRLAVLDHLFPDGGGVIVFDDPFTDMDAERTAQSCELIKECATRHQVIFLTCREDYLTALEGNRICF